MKKVLVLTRSVAGAALLTLVLATAALLLLMFTSDEAPGRREAFFGSLLFESRDAADGTTTVTLGVEDPLPLVALFVFLTVLLTVIQLTYRTLRQYRQQLLDQGDEA